MSYTKDLKKSWQPLAESLRQFGKAVLTLDPWKQFRASFHLVVHLHWFALKATFFSVKKIAGKYP